MQRRNATAVTVIDAGDVIGSAIAEKSASKGFDIKEEQREEALAHLEPGRLMRPEAVAEVHWQPYLQPGGARTSEEHIPPFGEPW